jgi:hypothetical protein
MLEATSPEEAQLQGPRRHTVDQRTKRKKKRKEKKAVGSFASLT